LFYSLSILFPNTFTFSWMLYFSTNNNNNNIYIQYTYSHVLQQKSINCNWICEIVLVGSRLRHKQKTLISLINVSIGQTKYFSFSFIQGLNFRLNLHFLIFLDSLLKIFLFIAWYCIFFHKVLYINKTKTQLYVD